MSGDLSRNDAKLIAAARRFAREVVAPRAGGWEVSKTVPRDALSAAADIGLTGLLVPTSLGGQGLGVMAMAQVMEELGRACMAFAFSLVVHNNLAANIARNGTREQIDGYLPGLLAARRIGAFLLTEPQGGSDAAAITTAARREGSGDEGGWVLNGEKAWVSNGAVADVLSVYVQTAPEDGSRGIACFLVDGGAPGVTRERPYEVMGGYALGTTGFRFDDVKVEDNAMLLAPGKAFKAAMAGIDLARINVAALCCGMMRAGLEHAVERAGKRRAFGHALADFQGLQWMLADVATDLEASRQLTYHAAREHDAGNGASLASAHAKKFATRAALRRLPDCMQVLGAHGFRLDDGHPLARHMASAKMAEYLDGTTEIQNVVISRRLFAGR